MRLDSDDFELFALQRRFQQDVSEIDARRRVLQAEVHPDRFAGEGPAAQRLAMQWSLRVNEAYQRLRDPLRRAAYLCELLGSPVLADSNTSMPPDFLVQQMSWREALDEAGSQADLNALSDQVSVERVGRLSRLQDLLDLAQDAPAAVREVRALMFIERFNDDVQQRLERFDT